ncbi:gram-negative porin family protein [Paraburkholderia xenovorans LB400]|nr:gram-negative porin family protein [Paraburkholderia xenovorans LB400]
MKKSTIGALLLGGFSTIAHAQSSVTLYGNVDTGIAYTSNVQGKSLWQETQGIGLGNRWGLLGQGDLGNGLKAIFRLENGYSSSSGALLNGGRLFGRQAYVGLSQQQFGAVTFGRQYDSVVDYVSLLASSKQYADQMGAHIGDNDNMFNSLRINNSVKYASSQIAGLSFGGLYAFSNQASGGNSTGFSNDSAFSVGAAYTNGPLKIAAAFLQLNHPSSGNANGSNTGGAISGDYNTLSTNIFYSQPVAKQTVGAAGANYKISGFTIGAVFSDVVFDYNDGTSLRLLNYEANVSYQITQAIATQLVYTFTDGTADGGASYGNFADGRHPRWQQVTAGASYSLSKATSLYVLAAYQLACGDAQRAAISPSGGETAWGHRSQIELTTGITVKF